MQEKHKAGKFLVQSHKRAIKTKTRFSLTIIKSKARKFGDQLLFPIPELKWVLPVFSHEREPKD